MPAECPPPVQDLFRQCQAYAPEARPSFAALRAGLQRVLSELTAGDGDMGAEVPLDNVYVPELLFLTRLLALDLDFMLFHCS